MVVEDLNGAEGENQSTYIPMNTLYLLKMIFRLLRVYMQSDQLIFLSPQIKLVF